MSKTNLTIERLKELKGSESQEKFAKRINSSQSCVSKMLKGMPPSANTLIAISREYNVSVDWLLGLTENKMCIPSSENLTYADAIAVLDKLFELNSVNCERRRSSSILYVQDRVLSYLLESRSKIEDLDINIRRYWYKNTAAHFANIKVLEWEDEYNELYDETISEKPEDSEVINLVKALQNRHLSFEQLLEQFAD